MVSQPTSKNNPRQICFIKPKVDGQKSQTQTLPHLLPQSNLLPSWLLTYKHPHHHLTITILPFSQSHSPPPSYSQTLPNPSHVTNPPLPIWRPKCIQRLRSWFLLINGWDLFGRAQEWVLDCFILTEEAQADVETTFTQWRWSQGVQSRTYLLS